MSKGIVMCGNGPDVDTTENYMELLCAMVRIAQADSAKYGRFSCYKWARKRKIDADEFIEWCRGNLV